MRDWLSLVEGYEDDIQKGYTEFLEVWLAHYRTWEEDLDEPEPTFDQYIEYAEQICDRLKTKSLYRGMLLGDLSYLDSGPLGIHWSTDFGIANSFSDSGRIYDRRFADAGRGTRLHMIVIEIQPVNLDAIVIGETIGYYVAAGESEIRLKQDQPVTIKSVWIDRQQVDHTCIGKTILT